MPLWLIILQVVVPMIKTVVDMIRSNPPAEDASQAHKDAHAAVLACADSLHCAASDAMKAA